MRKPKLSDVELSKVLSRAAEGTLDHRQYGSDFCRDCGCVAGTVFDIGDNYAVTENWRTWRKAQALSRAVNPGLGRQDYGGDPDSVLRHLEKCGVT